MCVARPPKFQSYPLDTGSLYFFILSVACYGIFQKYYIGTKNHTYYTNTFEINCVNRFRRVLKFISQLLHRAFLMLHSIKVLMVFD